MIYNGSGYSTDQAVLFACVLNPDADEFCFQTFDDSPSKDPRIARTLHGALATLEPVLRALNERGAGVFITPNEIAPGQRRTAENVRRVRAVFADNDNPGRQGHVEAEIARRGLPPSIIVESSPGKRHYYWTVADCPLDCFKPMQRAIAATLGTDQAVCDLPRVMRLPGLLHMKGTPFLVRVVGGTGARYRMTQIEAAFPDAPTPATPYQARARSTSPTAGSGTQAVRLRAHLDHFGGLVTPAVRAAVAEAQHGERHLMLRAIVARLVPLRWPDAEVRALVLPAALEAWPDVDGRELTRRLDHVLAWVRAQEASKVSALPSAPARVAAAFGAYRRAGAR